MLRSSLSNPSRDANRMEIKHCRKTCSIGRPMPKSEPSDNAANNSASRTLLPAGITPTEQSYDNGLPTTGIAPSIRSVLTPTTKQRAANRRDADHRLATLAVLRVSGQFGGGAGVVGSVLMATVAFLFTVPAVRRVAERAAGQRCRSWRASHESAAK